MNFYPPVGIFRPVNKSSTQAKENAMCTNCDNLGQECMCGEWLQVCIDLDNERMKQIESGKLDWRDRMDVTPKADSVDWETEALFMRLHCNTVIEGRLNDSAYYDNGED